MGSSAISDGGISSSLVFENNPTYPLHSPTPGSEGYSWNHVLSPDVSPITFNSDFQQHSFQSSLPSLSLNGRPLESNARYFSTNIPTTWPEDFQVFQDYGQGKSWPVSQPCDISSHTASEDSFSRSTPPAHNQVQDCSNANVLPSTRGMSRTNSAVSNRSRCSSSSSKPAPVELTNRDAAMRLTANEIKEARRKTDGRRLRTNLAPSANKPHGVIKNVVKKGRKGPLDQRIRKEAANMRKLGACLSCRKRRAKCDGGTPCTSCIRYHKGGLVCRGKKLEDIAEAMICGNVFPSGGPLEQFLGNGCKIDQNEYTILIELGFGAPMPVQVKMVELEPANGPITHLHTNYPWPPQKSEYGIHIKSQSTSYVFPAILSNLSNMETNIDNHLSMLLEDRENFSFFPLYRSPLQVLRHIYIYYKDLPDNFRKPLGLALKLLIIIHIGGDTRVKFESTSRSIMQKKCPECQPPELATPCFIRSQLGRIYHKLASRILRDVLKELECLSMPRALDCSKRGLIVSTFAVLSMAVESQQYHISKVPFHGNENPNMPDVNNSETSEELDLKGGANALLTFYKSCFPTSNPRAVATSRTVSPAENSIAVSSETFLAAINTSIISASGYLENRAKLVAAPPGDMSCYFDRLLAKLLLN